MATTRWFVTILGSAATLVVAGCGRPPSDSLARARAAYQEAEQTPDVRSQASVALHEAGQSLQQAQQAYDKGKDIEDVNALAYVAERKAEVAREQAREKVAEHELQQLSEQKPVVVAPQVQQRTVVVNPPPQRGQQTTRGTVIPIPGTLFETGRAELKPGAMRELASVADTLRREPDRMVVIEGHTDNAGSAETNERLSQERADAVREYLIAQGINGDRIQARGLGSSFPVASNTTAAGRQQNRRVDVIIQPPGATAGTAGRQPVPEAPY